MALSCTSKEYFYLSALGYHINARGKVTRKNAHEADAFTPLSVGEKCLLSVDECSHPAKFTQVNEVNIGGTFEDESVILVFAHRL